MHMIIFFITIMIFTQKREKFVKFDSMTILYILGLGE